MATKQKKIFIEVLEHMIDILVKEQESFIFEPTYYKNLFLKEAIRTHLSPRCVIRTYAEMLKTAYKYTNDNTDMLHANALLNYLRICDDEKDLEYINDLVYFLRNQVCEVCKEEFPYLILDPNGRIKAFTSYEANERNKLLRFKILRDLNTSTIEMLNNLVIKHKSQLLESFQKMYSAEDLQSKFASLDRIFTNENVKAIKLYIQEALENTVRKSSHSDLIGYRLIVYSVNHSTEEEVLLEYLYPLEEKIKDFFLNEGFLCTKCRDFISSPKPNGYKSIHLQFEILQISVEFQIRTKLMDDIAEHGSAAHDKEYKDKNPMYLFINELLRNFSDEYGKTDVHKLLGLLKPLDTSNRPWNSTTETIPYTPKELKEFEDVDFITQCLNM